MSKKFSAFMVCIFVIELIIVSFCLKKFFYAGIIAGVGIFILFAILVLYIRYSYNKQKQLLAYINKISNKEIFIDVSDSSEGLWSVIKSEIYKFGVNLSEQSGILQKEKELLHDFLYDIFHQLKTPLTSLMVMSDLLEEDDLPKEKKIQFHNNLRQGLLQMEWLVVSLLKIAKLDADVVQLKKECTATNELIQWAIEPLTLLIYDKQQIIKIENDANLEIICDINWTSETLTNIIKNAIEHNKIGEEIIIECGRNPIYDWISVTDRGDGILKKDIPHLFERFYRGNSTKTNSFGIGLSMCMSIMRKQKGDIEVHSKPGEGSTFILKFYRA